jgi:LysR family transcriptional regulator, hypochlorite-specific transcription factor HypT
MLAGEVDFLLCHYHGGAPTRFDPDRFQSIAVGFDILVPVTAPDAEGHPIWPLVADPQRRTRLLAYSQASGLGRILAAHQVTKSEALDLETCIHISSCGDADEHGKGRTRRRMATANAD